jgi:hypothetical protein
MPRTIDEDDPRYQDAVDENGIIRDGKAIRVSFFDAARARGWAPPDTRLDGSPFVVDSRPGAWAPLDQRRALTDAELRDARQRIADAIAEHDARDANAWRNPPNGPRSEYTGGDPLNTGAGAPGCGSNKIPVGAYPLSAGEGNRCTINGQDGRLVRKGNWLVCEPTRTNDAQSLQDARAEAYRLYDEEMANAWRNPR